MSESMQRHVESQHLTSPSDDHVVDRAASHRPSFIRHPKPIVSGSIWDPASESFEVEINSPGERLTKQEFQGLFSLRILARDIEHPEIAGPNQLFADAERGQSAAGQGK